MRVERVFSEHRETTTFLPCFLSVPANLRFADVWILTRTTDAFVCLLACWLALEVGHQEEFHWLDGQQHFSYQCTFSFWFFWVKTLLGWSVECLVFWCCGDQRCGSRAPSVGMAATNRLCAAVLLLSLSSFIQIGTSNGSSSERRQGEPWAVRYSQRMRDAYGSVFVDERERFRIHMIEKPPEGVCWTAHAGRHMLGDFANGYTGRMRLLRAKHYCLFLGPACALSLIHI